MINAKIEAHAIIIEQENDKLRREMKSSLWRTSLKQDLKDIGEIIRDLPFSV